MCAQPLRGFQAHLQIQGGLLKYSRCYSRLFSYVGASPACAPNHCVAFIWADTPVCPYGKTANILCQNLRHSPFDIRQKKMRDFRLLNVTKISLLNNFENFRVKKMRLELTRPNGHYPLKVARLPIPPLLHILQNLFLCAQNRTRTCTSLNTRT